MSLFTNSYRKLSQQQSESDSVKIYYKTDMKQYAKVRYNRATTVGQIIDELIKELNLNGKLQYQIYILSHKKSEPSLGGISIKRKLRRNEQPFRILIFTKAFKYSFYLDYMLSQLSQNIQDQNNDQSETYTYQFTKYQKEFNILKVTKNGSQKQIKLKINSQGVALCQEGKMEKLIFYSDCKFDFEEDLVFTITQEEVFIYRAINKSEFTAINKLIYQFTKNIEIKYQMINQDNKIESCTKNLIEQMEIICYEFTQSKQKMKENQNFKQFLDIFKITQINQDPKIFENDEPTFNIFFMNSILETLSILPREQYKTKLVDFNPQYKYTASCKIEDQIEEYERLLQPLESILISAEEARKYSQFLS